MPINLRLLGAAVAALAGLAMGLSFVLVSSAQAYPTTGQQRLIVIPLEVNPHAPEPDCQVMNALGCPRHTAAEWQQLLDTSLNGFYGASTWNQVSWNVRVITNPDQANGWWPSPHTNDEYAKFLSQDGASFFSTSPPSDVSDAMIGVLGKAIVKKAVTANELSSATRYLVLTNYHGFGGQTHGGLANYTTLWPQGNSIQSLTLSPTISWANEDTTDAGSLTVIQHELGHQLGEPDLYGDPCLLTPPGEPQQTAAKTKGDCLVSWDPMGLSDVRNIAFGYYTRLLSGWVNPYSPTTRTELSSFSGPVSLSSIEYPNGDPVALHFPDDPGALVMARAFGNHKYLNGFVAECRRTAYDDPIRPWRRGVLISYVDSRKPSPQVIVRPRFTSRGDTNNSSWEEWLLLPGDNWYNESTGIVLEFKGFDSKGGCSLQVNAPAKPNSAPHFVPAVSENAPTDMKWIGGKAPRAVYANPGVVVNGPRIPIPRGKVGGTAGAAASREAVAGALNTRRPVRVEAPVRGRKSKISFAYGNAGSAGSGTATVRVEQPYVARPACGAPRRYGRVVGRVKLRRLAERAAGVASVAWRPRSNDPAAISVSLRGAGEPAARNETSTTVVGFQTLRAARGKRKRATGSVRISLSVPRDCDGPRTFSVNQAIMPKGWTVKVVGGTTTLGPGKRKTVRIVVTAPKGAKRAATTLPITVSSTANASPLQDSPTSIFSPRHEPERAGGFDLLSRVSAPGRKAPAFVLPAFAGLSAAPKGAPPLAPNTGAVYSARSVSISSCSVPVVPPTAVNVAGAISPARANVPVTLTYTPLLGPPTPVVTQTVMTDAAGNFSDTFERQSNDWNVVATVAPTEEFDAAASTACHVPIP